MPTFKIYTLGCKVNQYDSTVLRDKLKKNGFRSTFEMADLVIVNTCSVTKNAHRKDRQIIKKARKENPGAKIVIMGCWYKIYPELVEKIEADLFWPVGQLDGLLEELKGMFKINNRLKEQGITLNNKKIVPPGKGERARYFMKVQDGCEQFCSYCVIPYSRGRLKSRNINKIIKEAQEVEKVGYREINLCGIHLGLYGIKSGQGKYAKDEDKKLAKLIKEIIKNTKRVRVRLSSIEINDITNELIELLKNEKRFCNHLHIPLQGGEDKLLQLMNRPYNTEYFKIKINKIRKKVPDVAITTDVIVGFPSETSLQFKKTYEFVKSLKFAKLHVFPYSKHEKSAAFKMIGQVNGETKKKRAKILRSISDKLWNEYQGYMKSKYKKFEVLLEQDRKNGVIGKTEYYFDIKIPTTERRNKQSNIGKLQIISL